MKKSYTQLTIEEREQMALLRVQKKPLREIARVLGRHHTTLSRELRRNSYPSQGCYRPWRAAVKSRLRKKEAGKRTRLKDSSIREYVIKKLKEGWSPEQVSGRIDIYLPGKKVSHEAIYQYVYHEAKELIALLPRRHKNRHAHRPYDRHKNLRVSNRTSISERPWEASQRIQFGHWEADSMVGGVRQPAAASVLVERKSRLVKISLLKRKDPREVRNAVVRRLGDLTPSSRLSITYDNGTENREHEAINQILGTKSYFCRPYHSWEKGTVENTIGLIRRFLPKGTNLKNVSHAQLQEIEDLLNDRPRKCLNYQTPNEVYKALSGALAG
jgi:transposase, IS30 family